MTNRPDCPLCPNNVDMPILAQTEQAYLIGTRSGHGNFLIIPKEHTESLLDLPDTWWHAVKTLLPQVPGLPEQYNLSINIGKDAGQTVKHLHFWVVPRAGGQSASGKGLALLIREANESTDRH